MIRVELFSIQMTSLGSKESGPMKRSGELGCKYFVAEYVDDRLFINVLRLDCFCSTEIELERLVYTFT